MDTTYIDRLGNLVSTIGSAAFGGQFYELARDLIDAEECTVFSFPDPSSPRMMIVESGRPDDLETARRLAREYVSGGFLGDPNVHRKQGRMPLDIYIIDAEAITDAAYRQRFYNDPEVSHELVMMGKASGTLYYSSFYRKRNRATFGANDVEMIRAIAGFMIRALHRHSQLTGLTDDQSEAAQAPVQMNGQVRERTLDYLKQTLFSGPYRLSQREAEVCAGIIMGYSTEAIGLNCEISTNTVATHRKRAYAKLGISSQNELFMRYFSAVREIQNRMLQ